MSFRSKNHDFSNHSGFSLKPWHGIMASHSQGTWLMVGVRILGNHPHKNVAYRGRSLAHYTGGYWLDVFRSFGWEANCFNLSALWIIYPGFNVHSMGIHAFNLWSYVIVCCRLQSWTMSTTWCPPVLGWVISPVSSWIFNVISILLSIIKKTYKP
jgi:hypothetical protein